MGSSNKNLCQGYNAGDILSNKIYCFSLSILPMY